MFNRKLKKRIKLLEDTNEYFERRLTRCERDLSAVRDYPSPLYDCQSYNLAVTTHPENVTLWDLTQAFRERYTKVKCSDHWVPTKETPPKNGL